MNIVGESVSHNAFGMGTVSVLADEVISVVFDGVEKDFIYPDAFKKFLTFENRDLQEFVEKQIKKKEALDRKRKRIESEENRRRHRLLNFKIVTNSHLIINIPSEQVDSVFETLSVSTGKYLSGKSKGLPRTADRVKPNSVCFITSCPEGEGENGRLLVGAFMAEESFFGDEADDGIINGHPEYCIQLPAAHRVPFWSQTNKTPPVRWGSIVFKYCSSASANSILAKMVRALAQTNQAEEAHEFYRYFCDINRLRSLIEVDAKKTRRKSRK